MFLMAVQKQSGQVSPENSSLYLLEINAACDPARLGRLQ